MSNSIFKISDKFDHQYCYKILVSHYILYRYDLSLLLINQSEQYHKLRNIFVFTQDMARKMVISICFHKNIRLLTSYF